MRDVIALQIEIEAGWSGFSHGEYMPSKHNTVVLIDDRAFEESLVVPNEQQVWTQIGFQLA
jgi:hypothetical protein